MRGRTLGIITTAALAARVPAIDVVDRRAQDDGLTVCEEGS